MPHMKTGWPCVVVLGLVRGQEAYTWGASIKIEFDFKQFGLIAERICEA